MLRRTLVLHQIQQRKIAIYLIDSTHRPSHHFKVAECCVLAYKYTFNTSHVGKIPQVVLRGGSGYNLYDVRHRHKSMQHSHQPYWDAVSTALVPREVSWQHVAAQQRQLYLPKPEAVAHINNRCI